jgi:hypothetical protein
MQGCYNLLWGSKSLNDKIRATPGCSKMTDADLIQIAGYVAVVKAGGAPKDGKGCGFYPGRPDATGYDDVSCYISHSTLLSFYISHLIALS